MHIAIPDINESLERLLAVESTFDGTTQPISLWVSDYRAKLIENRKLLENSSPTNDILVLNIFLRDVLVRAIKGEMGSLVHKQLNSTIKTKADLNEQNYRQVLKNAKYRWGVDEGSKVISGVVQYVE